VKLVGNGLYRRTLDPSRFAFFFFEDDGHRGDDNDQNDLALLLTGRAMVPGPESLVLLSLGLVSMAPRPPVACRELTAGGQEADAFRSEPVPGR
jgi:hypothetical protein